MQKLSIKKKFRIIEMKYTGSGGVSLKLQRAFCEDKDDRRESPIILTDSVVNIYYDQPTVDFKINDMIDVIVST